MLLYPNRLIVMSTNLEYGATERERKRESRRQASEAQREKKTKETLGSFIRGKIRHVLNKPRTVPFIRACLI